MFAIPSTTFPIQVAIAGSFAYHLECIGPLLEAYHHNTSSTESTTRIHIYLSSKSDKYGSMDYYKNICNYSFELHIDEFPTLNKTYNQYNRIYKLTHNDPCIDSSLCNNIISILHLKDPLTIYPHNYLSLTPYITGPNIKRINSVYHLHPQTPQSSSTPKENIITFIGYYTNDNIDDDTINFIKQNSDYTFNFVINTSPKYPNLERIRSKYKIKINIIQHASMTKLHNILQKSKYILSKKYINKDRFSGQLGLAMTYNIPLIIDKYTKDAYDLPGISFTHNYSEIGRLSDVTPHHYAQLLAASSQKKHQLLHQNKILLTELL